MIRIHNGPLPPNGRIMKYLRSRVCGSVDHTKTSQCCEEESLTLVATNDQKDVINRRVMHKIYDQEDLVLCESRDSMAIEGIEIP